MAESTPPPPPSASLALSCFLAEVRPLLGHLATAVHARLLPALAPGALDPAVPAQDAQRIRQAYRTWQTHLPRNESHEHSRQTPHTGEMQRRQAFSEQTGYMCFTRLLLARVLEDKAIGPGLASISACKRWLRALNLREAQAPLPRVYRQAARLYLQLVPPEVFDWFEPEDALLTLVLHQLRRFTFADLCNDLPGQAYEAMIERGARNQRGHFLTPPDLVEFLLDRAGYCSPTIIGASLLDPSCGSGRFLVQAARRLRSAIQSTLAHRSPAQRASRYIELVQTTLVGLEIDPFACYLARLNLFLQILDDLALLWREQQDPQIVCFAIYTTNSLDMPAPCSRQVALPDEAAPVKALQQHFRYILCNPPYINRGITLHAQRYAEHPFYREIVKGDENFSLLFLRLATYYLAPAGTLCVVCPLNLLGDESTMRAREMFGQADTWRLRSITRFYSRTALFPGVVQGVCVVRIDRAAARDTDTIEIAGGSTIAAAKQRPVQIAYTRVTTNYPPQATWSKPWLVHAQPEVYDLWEWIRHRCRQDLAGLIAGKLEAAKGDVRSTWAQPLRIPAWQPGALPVTKGATIAAWGNWSAAAYLDPAACIPPGTAAYKNSLWVQKRARRIANLAHPETVLLLKEIAGLEMQRPLRGTLTERSSSHPFVADETVLVIYTRDPAHDTLACALFGLITSAFYNYLFTLFSTNAHASLKEILRLPVPAWNQDLEQRLATATRAALGQGGEDAHRVQQALDEQVIEAYGIEHAAWKRLITAGCPWTRGPARDPLEEGFQPERQNLV